MQISHKHNTRFKKMQKKSRIKRDINSNNNNNSKLKMNNNSNSIHTNNTYVDNSNNNSDNNSDDNYSDDPDDSDNSDDSDESDYSEYLEDSDNSDMFSDLNESDNDKLNKYEYAKFLNKIFPSSYSKNRINQIKRRRLISPKSVNNNTNHIIKWDNKIINENKHNDSDNDDSDINDNDNDSDKDSEISKSQENLYKKIAHKLALKINNELINNSDEDSDKDSDKDSDEDLDESLEDDLDYDLDDELGNKSKKKNKTSNKKDNYKNKNYKEYKKIFKIDKNKESDYFKENLSNDEQLQIIQTLNTIKSLSVLKKPYLIHLAQLNIPDNYKVCAINKVNILNSIDPDSANGEYYKLKTWIDSFMKIPFDIYCKIPVHISDGLDICNSFLLDAKKTLDTCVYGLENAKLQIIQLLGLWIVNPDSVGTSIAIKGPMGVGKTTLIKEGVSKVLDRYFTFLALGGANDVSYFEGHGYTYEGSTYGKMIDILIQAKQMNPIIYFDELDKVSDSPKGDEIIGLLTHLTDSTQNNCYHDKYFSEIEFDLSKILYIFSYNDESKINPILRDRMYHIEIKGYDINDKIEIVNNHLLPKIRENINFKESDVTISDDIIKYIVNNHTQNEEGVRNLKRCFEAIYTKLNLLRLVKNDNDEFYKMLKLNNTTIFPITMTNELVDKLIQKKNTNVVPFGMYT